MVDPDFDPEEERLLDQKFDSVWQPQWAGESRIWRIFVRGAVIGLAVALLWLTSLTLATTIAGIYVSAPTYDDAVNQWSFASQIASQEQANAGECVVREIATCHRVLNKTYDALILKASEEALRNDLIVQHEAEEAAFCQKSWDTSYLATSTILKKILLTESLYSDTLPNTTCTPDDVVHLKQLLGDVSQQKSDVYLKNVEYSRDSNRFLASAAESAANRSAYDAWYIQYKLGFLGNWSFKLWNASFFHIDDIDAQFNSVDIPISNLINCIGLNGSCTFAMNAKKVYQDMKTAVETQYNETKRQLGYVADSVHQFNASMYQYFQQAEIIFTRLKAFGDVNAVLTQLNIPTLSIDYPDWREYVTDIMPMPDMLPLPIPDASAQFQQVKPTLNQIMPAVGQAKQKVHDAAVRWMNAINNSMFFPNMPFSIPNYFADYNPPEINVDTSGFAVISDNFLESSRLSLDGFNSLDNTSFTYNASSVQYAQIVKKLPTFSSFSLMSTPFEGEFDFYNVFSSLGSILFLLISADIIYRVFKSVAIVRKYTRMGELGLPVIDIREYEAAKQSENPTLAMYYLCTSPFIILIVLAVIGLIILGALVALYVPMYQSYQRGCVNSNNGTLLTKNAYAFAYNYAASDANEATGEGLSKYDKQRTEYCTVATAQFNDRQKNAQDGLTKIRHTYDNNAHDLALFQRCIVPSALPTDPAVWYNLTNYDSPFSNTSLAARLQCNRPGVYITTGLGDGSFDCQKLPPCNLTCTGPDKEALLAVTYDSGCVSEWTFHAGLFRTLLGLLVFVCLNISRLLLMTAVIRLCWRQLTSRGFEFQGTCSKLGTVVGLEERLKVAVDKAIKEYERGALLMLVGAVLIHLPYLLVLHQYGDHLNANGVHN